MKQNAELKSLPNSYLEYLESNKLKEGELSVNPFWFQLWSKSEIEVMNKNYKVQDYLQDYIGFGSNGGGELLVFDKIGKIYTIPFIPMVQEDAMVVAESWDDFLKLIVKDHD